MESHDKSKRRMNVTSCVVANSRMETVAVAWTQGYRKAIVIVVTGACLRLGGSCKR